MKTITRGPRGLGLSIFLAVLFALVADATAQQPAELIIRNGLIVTRGWPHSRRFAHSQRHDC